VSANSFRRLGYRVGIGLTIALVIASLIGGPAYAAGGALLFASPRFFSSTPVGSTTTSSVVLSDDTIDDLGVHIDSVQITGTDAGEFSVVGDRCSGATLWWPQQAYSCQIDIAFTPTQAGFRRATLAVVSDAANGPVNIELVGEGVLSADLAANLTAAAKVLPQHKLTYGITVSNAGPLDASSNLILSLPLGVTKEKPGFWTHRRAFGQVRHDPNIQLLSYSLVAITHRIPRCIRRDNKTWKCTRVHSRAWPCMT
jgi:hypothetical protein